MDFLSYISFLNLSGIFLQPGPGRSDLKVWHNFIDQYLHTLSNQLHWDWDAKFEQYYNKSCYKCFHFIAEAAMSLLENNKLLGIVEYAQLHTNFHFLCIADCFVLGENVLYLMWNLFCLQSSCYGKRQTEVFLRVTAFSTCMLTYYLFQQEFCMSWNP